MFGEGAKKILGAASFISVSPSDASNSPNNLLIYLYFLTENRKPKTVL
jgi:hypothetical protein